MQATTHQTNLHGVMLKIAGHGVLITGEAGIGKSSFALQLIESGNQLIADDVVDIKLNNHKLFANCPTELIGLLHTRELGLIDIRSVFGENALCPESEINFVVELSSKSRQPQQLHINDATVDYLGVQLPKLVLCIYSLCSLETRLLTWIKNRPFQTQTESLFVESQKRSMQQ